MVRKAERSEDGFSLLELTITLVLIGLFIGGAVALYSQIRQRDLMERNATAILTMKSALDSYFVVNQRWPCPAPLDAKPGDAEYGVSMDCADTSPGDYTLITNPSALINGVPKSVRIRQGTFPFMTLREFMADEKISRSNRPGGSDVMDAYGRQFTYVVTEPQATDQYADKAGAIVLKDEHDRDVSTNANFLLISHGENGAGARTPDGSLRADCNTSLGKDKENCDGDHIFLHGLQFRADGPEYNDDQVAFIQWTPYYLWEQTEIDRRNFHNINPGKVGIGVKNPTEQLHIKDGDLLTYRFWGDTATAPITIGSASAVEICSDDGTDCFSPELIGGDIFPQCAADEILVGIYDGKARCKKSFNTNFSSPACGVDGYVGSMTYNAVTQQISTTCKYPKAGR